MDGCIEKGDEKGKKELCQRGKETLVAARRWIPSVFSLEIFVSVMDGDGLSVCEFRRRPT